MNLKLLTVEELVEFVNNELKRGVTLSKICKENNCRDAYISNRLKKAGYTREIIEGNYQYFIADNVAHSNNSATRKSNNNATKNVTDNSNLATTKVAQSNNIKKHSVTQSNFTELELANLKALSNVADRLIKLVKIEKSMHRNNKIHPATIRFDEGLYNEFKKKAKEQNTSITELINRALEEYLIK